MSMAPRWAWRRYAVWLLFCILALRWLAASDVFAAGFVLTEGQFKAVQSASGTVDDSIDCSYPSEVLNIIFMTPAPKTNPQDSPIANQSGKCVHAKPFQLLDADDLTVMSFSTTFTFALVPGNSPGESIDGLAFIIVPAVGPPENSAAGYLGLLNATTDNQQSSHTFAVEFDTYPNYAFNDPFDDHVGIDINSLTSTNLSRAGYYSAKCPGDDPFNPVVLKDGSTIQAWIAYDAHTQHVSVTISSLPGFKPDIPLLDVKVNLSGVIQEEMYVGFSTSTGAVGGHSYVFNWSFEVNGSAGPINSETVAPAEHCPASKTSTLPLVLGLSIPMTLLAIGVVACLGRFYLHRTRRNIQDQFHDLVELDSVDSRPRKYGYKELSAATEGFSSSHVLGSGGFGSVYKGTLPGGSNSSPTVLAVKRISAESTQGSQEYVSEVKIIGRLRHRNLVQLLGWCNERDELLLVYEYMSNGSLDQWLFQKGNSNGGTPALSWTQRLHILSGVATALVYIHEEWKQVVVHRDVKASNVMLDSGFNAKLGDFGLARLHERLQDCQRMSVAGTLGYMAPETGNRGIFTDKSDVFSFGVLALEVACGRRPVDVKRPAEEIVLTTWVWDLYEQDQVLAAVDDNLIADTNSVDEKSKAEISAVLQIGLLCCHPDPDVRPTMRQVLQMLKGEAPLLPIPPLPNRSRSRASSLSSFSFGNHYQWNDHSVELGMIENSEEIKLIPQVQNSASYYKEPTFSFNP